MHDSIAEPGLKRGALRAIRLHLPASYLVPSEAQWLDIWRMLHRLKMPDIMQVSQGLMVIPVQRYFQIGFRGGQFSGEKLEWLLSKGFKIIVDLWEEDVKDDLYLLAVQEAVSLGKIEVVNIPVEIGTAPSAKQVQRLTEVVSDSVKKPIYLHCQEGNVGASFDSDYILSVASGITNGKPSSNGASTSVEERVLFIQ
uniref:DSP-PTPase phosphatase fused to NAD+ Kinase domain-containing protein n=1 Tax=Oryza nivara TaxID=4536 RepID=A0A0E0IZ90_ORYNI